MQYSQQMGGESGQMQQGDGAETAPRQQGLRQSTPRQPQQQQQARIDPAQGAQFSDWAAI